MGVRPIISSKLMFDSQVKLQNTLYYNTISIPLSEMSITRKFKISFHINLIKVILERLVKLNI